MATEVGNLIFCCVVTSTLEELLLQASKDQLKNLIGLEPDVAELAYRVRL